MDKLQKRIDQLSDQMRKRLSPQMKGFAASFSKPLEKTVRQAEKEFQSVQNLTEEARKEIARLAQAEAKRVTTPRKTAERKQTSIPMKDYTPDYGLATPIVQKQQSQQKDMTEQLQKLAELKVRQEQAAQAVQNSVNRVKEALSQMAQAAGEAAGLTASKMENLAQRIALQKDKIQQCQDALSKAVTGKGISSAEAEKAQSMILKEEAALIGLIEKYNKAAETVRKLADAERQAGQAGKNLNLPSPINNQELDESIRKLDEIRRKTEGANAQGPPGGRSSWFSSFRKGASNVWSGITSGAAKVTAAFAWVKTNTDKATRSVKKYGKEARTAAAKAGSAFAKLGAIIKSALIFGTLYRGFWGLFSFIRNGIQAAINAPEIENMFRVAMGNMADEAAAFAAQFKKALGVDEYATKEQLGTYMNMIRTMGIGQKTAYKMSRSLTILANDMASLYNVPVEQAFENLQSAMSGQSRAVRKYGYVLNEATLKEVAYRNGIAATGAELTEQQKTLARYYALMEQSSAAQGDLARTTASLGNQLRMLKSNVAAAGRSIGEAFLPFVQAVVPWLNAFAIVLQRAGNALARFTYGLFGMDYDAEKKKQEQIISGIGGIADAEEEAGDAAEEAGKKAEASVMGFDELNKLQEPSKGAGNIDTGSGGGVEAPGLPELDIPDGESPYEELANKIQAALQKIKDALAPTMEALKGLWEQLKIVGGFAWDNLKNFYENFLKPVGQWILGENGLPRLINLITETLKEIEWQKINDSLARFYSELAKLTIFTGTKLIDFFELCLKPLTVWTLSEAFPRFVDLTTNALASLDYDRISDSMDRLFAAMNRIGQVVITGALDFYEHFLIPVGLWTMNEALPRLMDVLSKITENINWDNLLEHLRGFWDALAKFTTDVVGEGLLWILENVLEPLAEWTGNELLPAFLDALKAILESSVWQSTGQALKDLWENFFEPAAKWVGTKVLEFLDWIKNNGDEATRLILAIAAGLLTFKGAIAGIKTVMKIADFIKKIDEVKKAFQTVGITGSGVFTAIKTAAKTAISFIISHPIALLVAAVAAAVVLIVTHWDEIKEAAGKVWDWIVEKWNGLCTWFTEVVMHPLIEAWNDFWDGVKQAWENGWNAISDWWQNSAIKQWWDSHVAPWFTAERWKKLWDDVKKSWNDGWKAISDWWQNTAIKQWWDQHVAPWFTAQKWIDLWNGVKQGWTDGWNKIANWWQNTAIKQWWDQNVSPWFRSDKWSNLWNTVKSGWQNGWNGISSWWNSTIGAWWENDVKKWFTAEQWHNVLSGILDGFRRIGDEIVDWWNGTFLGKLFNSASEKVNEWMNGWNSKSSGSSKPRRNPQRRSSVYSLSEMRMTMPEVPEFAKGAVLRKPTLNLAGEYPGAAGNPEIVTPQSIMAETFEGVLLPGISILAAKLDLLTQAVKESGVEIDPDIAGALKIVQKGASDYKKRTGKPAF